MKVGFLCKAVLNPFMVKYHFFSPCISNCQMQAIKARWLWCVVLLRLSGVCYCSLCIWRCHYGNRSGRSAHRQWVEAHRVGLGGSLWGGLGREGLAFTGTLTPLILFSMYRCDRRKGVWRWRHGTRINTRLLIPSCIGLVWHPGCEDVPGQWWVLVAVRGSAGEDICQCWFKSQGFTSGHLGTALHP